MNEALITPQALQIAVFIGGLMGTLVVVEKVMSVIKFFRKDPPDHCLYARKEDVALLDKKLIATETKLETQIAALNDKISEQYAAIERSDESRTSGLHNRMNALATKIDTMTGANEVNKQFMEVVLRKLTESKS